MYTHTLTHASADTDIYRHLHSGLALKSATKGGNNKLVMQLKGGIYRVNVLYQE